MTRSIPTDTSNLPRPTPFDPFGVVADADERVTSFVAAINGAASYDEKRELWLQAIDDGQFETDLRILFGAASDIERVSA